MIRERYDDASPAKRGRSLRGGTLPAIGGIVVILAQTDGGNAFGFLLPFLLLALVFYFFLIRPQRTRMRQQQQLVDSLEIGQRVRTVGGIFGTVRAIQGDSVILEVEEGRLRVSLRAIGGRVDAGED